MGSNLKSQFAQFEKNIEKYVKDEIIELNNKAIEKTFPKFINSVDIQIKNMYESAIDKFMDHIIQNSIIDVEVYTTCLRQNMIKQHKNIPMILILIKLHIVIVLRVLIQEVNQDYTTPYLEVVIMVALIITEIYIGELLIHTINIGEDLRNMKNFLR